MDWRSYLRPPASMLLSRATQERLVSRLRESVQGSHDLLLLVEVTRSGTGMPWRVCWVRWASWWASSGLTAKGVAW